MIPFKEAFLQELKKELPCNVNKEDIIAEYSVHLDEKMEECPHLNWEDIVEQLGSPVEIAKQYEDSSLISTQFVQKNFVFCNFLFFIIGGLLTVGYHTFKHPIFTDTWLMLSKVSLVIVFIYTLFWIILGFEIGKEFGIRGKTLFSKTFLLCLIPNISLMIMTIFKMIPTAWFDPILTTPFIILCVLMTALLYPISRISYYIGVYRSL
ncbi:HAAS signaling domain-containing protein [Metabacillus fastidiosus]|uniref:DUF1700 domain-containing protein n=1 Tax=Metabacillus fastidiosus TaxID=1458 RepID=A0ABU6P1R4_9BACI|nr:hypothetical protein [Metabacillus fastidiosus]MED4402928.1 hypothetical protein [Metabacillus fastidiosus]MED4454283.1 hypothetical protein [Metabacillus fastidiosus]MED4461346.1 hypothetical protein [Metabacillus fastidiosus]